MAVVIGMDPRLLLEGDETSRDVYGEVLRQAWDLFRRTREA